MSHIKNIKYKLKILFFFLFILSPPTLLAQVGNAEKGSGLFKKECTACHSMDLSKELIGPALEGVIDKYTGLLGSEKNAINWLHKWIKDNASLRKSGDKHAIAIYEQYNKIEMNSFTHLTEGDINDLLAFIKNPPTPKEEKAEKSPTTTTQSDFSSLMKPVIIVSFVIIAILLLGILLKLYSLVAILKAENLQEYKKKNKFKWEFSLNLPKLLEKYRKLGLGFAGVFMLFPLFGIWDYLMNIDVNKGYKPDQPIYFSHKIHSGINKIDCQYCHSSAKYSKDSGIPSLNICASCHINGNIDEYKGEYIEEGKSKEFYTSEIQKIYKAMGWDPIKRQYSGETKPIKWVRIHNMPDFVYFNHSQHVVAGEEAIKKSKGVDLVCKVCHGEIDQMDQVEMANDFTMGWCINCHRTTEVDVDNKYYGEYFHDLHEKLKKQYPEKKNISITVDAVGGIECAKCHY